MAGSSGFFDATELADGTYDKTYVAEQFAKYFAMFVGNGVFANPANQLKVVSADNGMYVTVKAGRAFINGYWFELDADYTFAVQINDTSTNDRIDGVFVQLDTSEGVIDIVYEAGRSEVNRTAPIYELKLCDIAVPIASTSISNSQITDKRAYDSVCGFVTNLLQITSTEELFTQWTTAYNEWKTALEGWEVQEKASYVDWTDDRKQEFLDWMEVNKTDYLEWFEGIRDHLTEDVEGHLQTEINDTVEREFNRFYGTLNKTVTFNRDSNGKITSIVEVTEEATQTTTFRKDDSTLTTYITTSLEPEEGLWNYVKSVIIHGNTITQSYTKVAKEE